MTGVLVGREVDLVEIGGDQAERLERFVVQGEHALSCRPKRLPDHQTERVVLLVRPRAYGTIGEPGTVELDVWPLNLEPVEGGAKPSELAGRAVVVEQRSGGCGHLLLRAGLHPRVRD